MSLFGFDTTARVEVDGLDTDIIEATNDDHGAENWALIARMWEKVNSLRTPQQLQEVVRLTRKRVQDSDPNHSYLGLVLTESFCKNCGTRFLRSLAYDSKFLDRIRSIVEKYEKTRGYAEIRTYRKALELVQAWGEEFVGVQDQYNLRPFVNLYGLLRSKGYKFPCAPGDTSRPPIFTPPPRSSPARPAAGGAAGGRSPASAGGRSPAQPRGRGSSSTGLSGELHGENAELANMARMTKEMLDETPDAASLRSNDVVVDLVAQLRQAGNRVMEEVQTAMAVDPSSVGALIMLNDEINSAVRLHDDIMAGRKKGGTAAAGSASEPGHGTPGGLKHARSGRGAGLGAGGDDDDNEEDLFGAALTAGGQSHHFGRKKEQPPGAASRKSDKKERPGMASGLHHGVSNGLDDSADFDGLGVDSSPPGQAATAGADDEDEDPFALDSSSGPSSKKRSAASPAPAPAPAPVAGFGLGIEPPRSRAGSRRSRGGSAASGGLGMAATDPTAGGGDPEDPFAVDSNPGSVSGPVQQPGFGGGGTAGPAAANHDNDDPFADADGGSGAAAPAVVTRESSDPFADDDGAAVAPSAPARQASDDPFADEAPAAAGQTGAPATSREDSDPFAEFAGGSGDAAAGGQTDDDPFAEPTAAPAPAPAPAPAAPTLASNTAAAGAADGDDDPFAALSAPAPAPAPTPAPMGRASAGMPGFGGMPGGMGQSVGGYPTGPAGSFQSMPGGGLPPLGASPGIGAPPGVMSAGGLPPLGAGHGTGGGVSGAPPQYVGAGRQGRAQSGQQGGGAGGGANPFDDF